MPLGYGRLFPDLVAEDDLQCHSFKLGEHALEVCYPLKLYNSIQELLEGSVPLRQRSLDDCGLPNKCNFVSSNDRHVSWHFRFCSARPDYRYPAL